MTQHCAYVDPSSLSLPSSSLKRPASPASSTDDSTPRPSDEPPRKRSRSAVTPEERKEARAHRNRIAAQNSRDRRKAQFTLLEQRVAELEEENRRLRAGIHVSPSPSISALSEPDVTNIEREQEQLRKRQEEQRIIPLLSQAYLHLQQAQFQLSPTYSQLSSQPASSPESSKTPSAPSNITSLSSAPSLPLSPSSPNSTLVDTPLLFSSGDSFEFSQSPALPATDLSLALPEKSLDLSLANNTPTRHLARVVNTVDHSTVSLQRPEDEAASDAAITRLFAEILASPPLGSCPLPSSCTSSEDALSKEVLTNTDRPFDDGSGLRGIDTIDWVEQVRAEMDMEKLLEMLPNAEDVAIDAILHSNVNFDTDMDFSSALTWDGVSVS
ncbi:hypothetical protein J3R82DRAFT_10375 [Butyriboletus roseoflavus]|nr:hypothetical protein J3R82DRAFT_10375 [Butyriboletus roseoflavus]